MDSKHNTPAASLPHDPTVLQVTPSDTTVTLPTPGLAHAPLAGAPSHTAPRFIFYPISWDGSEDLPIQNEKTDLVLPDMDDSRLHSPSAVFYSTDAFWSIDRWRRDVVKCGGSAADLLDPIQDADTPLPLLSLPHDHHGGSSVGTLPSVPPLCATDSNGSEKDSVQLWIHP